MQIYAIFTRLGHRASGFWPRLNIHLYTRSSFPQTSYEPEPTPAGTYNGQTSEPDSNNPFFSSDTGSEDSPKESPRLADPVLVRAVFDYDAVEPDEFTPAGVGSGS
jgi:hypothetical protein